MADPTCFKNKKKLSCIDRIITISPSSSQNSCVIETALGSFCSLKMIVSVIKTTFQKLKPKIVHY